MSLLQIKLVLAAPVISVASLWLNVVLVAQIRDSMAYRGWATDICTIYITSVFVLTFLLNCDFRFSDAAMSHSLSGASETHLQRSRALKTRGCELLRVQVNSQWFPMVHFHLIQALVSDAKHTFNWISRILHTLCQQTAHRQSKIKAMKWKTYKTKNDFSVSSGWRR